MKKIPKKNNSVKSLQEKVKYNGKQKKISGGGCTAPLDETASRCR